jgi:hypothetical protein
MLSARSKDSPEPQAASTPSVEASSLAPGGPAARLPAQAGPWARPDTGRRITADTIFDYMDGGGELYLAFRFDHLDVFEYTAADDSQGAILVELYSMKSSLDAFGLLSTDWTGEPVVLHAVPEPDAAPRAHTVPPHHALYGAGLLRLWVGSLYARAMASRVTPAAREAVLEIGRALAGDDRGTAPAFMRGVPRTAAAWPGADENSGLPIRLDRTCFFRSHLVLNSQYFLASRDILGLSIDAGGITTEYASARPGCRPVRLIVVRYPRAAAAAAAAAAFRRGYLPDTPWPEAATDGAAETPHGWVAYAAHDQRLAIVLDADDQTLAQVLVGEAVHVASTGSQMRWQLEDALEC